MRSHFSDGRRHDRRIVQLEGYRPRNVKGRSQSSENHVSQDLGAVIVILGRVFHETEAVDIANEGLAVRPIYGRKEKQLFQH